MQHSFLCRKRGKTWQIVLSYKDSSGSWKQKSLSGFRTKAEACRDDIKEQMLSGIRQFKSVDASGVTLRAFCEVYLQSKPDLAENTRKNYRYAVKRLGKLADVSLITVTPLKLAEQLAAVKGTPRTRKSVFVMTKALFTSAVAFGYIPVSPAAGMAFGSRFDEAGGGRRRTLTACETQTLLERLHKVDKEAWVLAAIAAYAGLRRGELAALTWPDVDTQSRIVTVNKQMAKGPHGYIIKRVKSVNGVRAVPIPPRLAQIIEEYRRNAPTYPEQRLTRYKTPDAFTSVVAKVLPGHSPHDLRHTYATRLVASGKVDIRTAAALLGDSVATIEQVYLHYTDEMRTKAAEDICQIFA